MSVYFTLLGFVNLYFEVKTLNSKDSPKLARFLHGFVMGGVWARATPPEVEKGIGIMFVSKRRFSGAAVVAGALLAWAAGSAPAQAGICTSTDDCTLIFDLGNGSSSFGSGNFGTVHLLRSGSTVSVTIDLAAGFFLIETGFPGAVGFFDNLGGGLTIDNFSSAAYSGSASHATDDLHFDGFGYANDAAATTAPSAGPGSKVNVLSFDVSKGTLDDVDDLLSLFSGGGDGDVYFVADVINTNTSGPGAGNTGLIGVTGTEIPPPPHLDIPEPATLGVIGTGLSFIGFTLWRRRQRG